MDDHPTQPDPGQRSSPILRAWTRYYPAPRDERSCWKCGAAESPLHGRILGPLRPPGTLLLCPSHYLTILHQQIVDEAKRELRPAPVRERAPGAGRGGGSRGRKADRDATIYRRFLSGETQPKLAAAYGLSPERIRHIISEQKRK